MDRKEVYALIDLERASQDVTWKDRSQYKKSAPHILILEEQIAKTRSEWYGTTRDAVISRLVKIAAIAVRALEEIER